MGPYSGKAQYLGVYPRGTGLSTPHTMQEVSLPQIRFVGAPDVWPPVSCPEYVVNSMVRFVWGPCCMSYVYCFTRAYFSKGKVKNKKNWEMNLILGVGMAKSSLRKRKSHQIDHIWFW